MVRDMLVCLQHLLGDTGFSTASLKAQQHKVSPGKMQPEGLSHDLLKAVCISDRPSDLCVYVACRRKLPVSDLLADASQHSHACSHNIDFHCKLLGGVDIVQYSISCCRDAVWRIHILASQSASILEVQLHGGSYCFSEINLQSCYGSL